MRSMGKFTTFSHSALSTVKVAGSLIDRHVLDHYWTALADIRQKGFYESLSQSSRPYIEAVWTNFHTDKPSLTEDLLSGKLVGNSWRAVRKWLGKSGPGEAASSPAASDVPQSHSCRHACDIAAR